MVCEGSEKAWKNQHGGWPVRDQRPVAPQSAGSRTSRIQHEEDFKDGEQDHKNCLSSQV